MINKVADFRKKFGIQQEFLAQEVGVSRQSIGSIENGRYEPSTELAIKIAHFFGLPVEEVFMLDSKQPWLKKERILHFDVNSIAQVNRNHNEALSLTSDTPVFGCKQIVPSEFQYGTFTLPISGGEVVALYNALLLSGHATSLSDLLFEFDGNEMPLLEGYAGTNPKELHRYLSAYDIPYIFCSSQGGFNESLKEGDSFIITYWLDKFFRETKGVHTISGIYENGCFNVYNYKDTDLEPRVYKTLGEILRGKKYFCGYLIERK